MKEQNVLNNQSFDPTSLRTVIFITPSLLMGTFHNQCLSSDNIWTSGPWCILTFRTLKKLVFSTWAIYTMMRQSSHRYGVCIGDQNGRQRRLFLIYFLNVAWKQRINYQQWLHLKTNNLNLKPHAYLSWSFCEPQIY